MKITNTNTQENTLLLGFPGNGLVGTLSISYLIYHLKFKQFGDIEIPDLIAPLYVENGEIIASIRSYKKNNLFIIISDIPFDEYFADEFALAVKVFCKKNYIKKIILASGMETINSQKKDKKIYGLVTHQKLENILYNNDLRKFLTGSIYGTDARLISIFRKAKIPTLILYVECHPFFPDPDASIVTIMTLAKVLDLKVDTKDMKNKMDQLRIQNRNLMEETIRATKSQKEKQQRIPQIYK